MRRRLEQCEPEQQHARCGSGRNPAAHRHAILPSVRRMRPYQRLPPWLQIGVIGELLAQGGATNTAERSRIAELRCREHHVPDFGPSANAIAQAASVNEDMFSTAARREPINQWSLRSP